MRLINKVAKGTINIQLKYFESWTQDIMISSHIAGKRGGALRFKNIEREIVAFNMVLSL